MIDILELKTLFHSFLRPDKEIKAYYSSLRAKNCRASELLSSPGRTGQLPFLRRERLIPISTKGKKDSFPQSFIRLKPPLVSPRDRSSQQSEKENYPFESGCWFSVLIKWIALMYIIPAEWHFWQIYKGLGKPGAADGTPKNASQMTQELIAHSTRPTRPLIFIIIPIQVQTNSLQNMSLSKRFIIHRQTR